MIKSVYIHIPFCDTICSYCDFCKYIKNSKWIDFYLNDELVSSVNLVAESEITKMTIFNLFEKTMNSWVTLLR